MKLKRGKIKDILSYLIVSFSTFTVAMIFMQNKAEFDDFLLSHQLNKQKFILKNGTKQNEFSKYLREIVRESFTTYLNHCPNSDEINPKTKECINNYNFSATLLESLETLYLLDLTDLIGRANKYVKKFSCSDIEWVNRNELWSRGIGSLIGAYLLSNNKLYINKAKECANILIAHDGKNKFAPFINLKTGETHYRPLEGNMFELSDAAAGLPELDSLYMITNDKKYSVAFNKLLIALPNADNKTFYSLYSSTNKNERSNDNKLNAKTLGFYYNIALLSKLTKYKIVESKFTKFFSNNLRFDESYSKCQIPLLLTSQLMGKEFDGQIEFMKKLFDEYSRPYSFIKNSGPNQIQTFVFDGSFLMYLFKKGNYNKIIELVTVVMNNCRTNAGISGIGRSINLDRIYFTNIQHSSFFGQWAKFGALSIIDEPGKLEKSLFNEKGHIIMILS